MLWGMWNLVPWPGMESAPSAVEPEHLNDWMTREVPLHIHYWDSGFFRLFLMNQNGPNPAEVCRWENPPRTQMGTRVSIHSSACLYLSIYLSIHLHWSVWEGRHLRWWTRLSTTQISAGFLNLNVLAKTHAGEMVEHVAELNVLSSKLWSRVQLCPKPRSLNCQPGVYQTWWFLWSEGAGLNLQNSGFPLPGLWGLSNSTLNSWHWNGRYMEDFQKEIMTFLMNRVGDNSSKKWEK